MSASNILEDISQALEVWSQQLQNVETKIRRVVDSHETLVTDLHRKVDAGIISEQDSIEFEYIADLWLNLYKSFICCSGGAGFADRDVIKFQKYSLNESFWSYVGTAVETVAVQCIGEEEQNYQHNI